MNLVSIRIITANIETLVNFYEQITGITAIQYTPDFAEVKTPSTTIAIGSTKTLQFFGSQDIAKPAENHSVIIEFSVDDVDKEFEKLKDFISSGIVQEPTVMPWGNKSLLFRDPNGNLVNFFTPVSKEAIEKFNSN